MAKAFCKMVGMVLGLAGVGGWGTFVRALSGAQWGNLSASQLFFSDRGKAHLCQSKIISGLQSQKTIHRFRREKMQNGFCREDQTFFLVKKQGKEGGCPHGTNSFVLFR